MVVTILEGVQQPQDFLFAETTNRIDQRLGAEVIDHLLRLPLDYFDRRPVGELGTRIAELEKIRNFLTGQALTTILDAAFSVIYVAVMMIYSWLLTFIALSVLPIQIGLTVLGAPYSVVSSVLQPKKMPRPEPSGGGAHWHPDGESPERGDGCAAGAGRVLFQFAARTLQDDHRHGSEPNQSGTSEDLSADGAGSALLWCWW